MREAQEEIDRELLVQTVTRLWANALRLDIPPAAAATKRRRPTKAKA